VKVIALPGLPPKGDVSDWLATHTVDELKALVHEAPLFNPQQLVSQPFKLALTSLADLLAAPDESTDWLVDVRVPAGSVCLLVGVPKAGKSTLAEPWPWPSRPARRG